MRFDARRGLVCLLFALCFLVLLAAQVLRWKYTGGNLIGDVSFYQMRLAFMIAETGQIPLFDAAYAGGTPILAAKGYALLLSFAPNVLSRVLPLLFGLLTLAVFLLLCRKLDTFTQIVAGLFLIISPPFLYVFSTVSPYAPALFLSLLALYVYLERQPHVGVALACSVAFFSLGCALLLFLAFLALRNYRRVSVYFYGIFFLLVLGVNYLPLFLSQGLPQAILVEQLRLALVLNLNFIEFGSVYGFALFGFLAALYGGFVIFSTRYRYVLFFFSALLTLFLSAYFVSVLFLVNFAVAFFASCGVKHLLEKRWSDATLRQLVLLLLICGFLFSSIAYLHELTSFAPTFSDGRGIDFLAQQPYGVVVAPSTHGSWILSSGQAIVLGAQTWYVDDPLLRRSTIDALYRSVHLVDAQDMLDFYDISYIWIDDDVLHRYWDGHSDRGLLAVMHAHPQAFSLVYTKDDVHIWEYAHV